MEETMFGFIVGTVCLVALFKVLRHGRFGGGWRHAHGCGHGYGGHGGWQGHGHDDFRPFGGWRGRGGPGFMLRGLFSRLETTPGQEKVIRDAFDKVREALHEARTEWKDTSDLSSLLRGETFDRTAAEGVSGKADASFAKVRVVLVEALASIHEALDDRQRRILADFIESRGRGFFGGGVGPGFFGGRGRDVTNERWV
jgi:Spy/CpxP family protein refolding chaperone